MYKKRAPSAHVSRFGLCTNGVQYGVGCGANLQSRVNQLSARYEQRVSAAIA
jgi:hypothetical protein